MALSKTKLLASAAVVASSLVLSACGSSNTVPTASPTPTPSTAVRQEDQFGVAFGTAFRADANGEPFAVNDGDLVPVTLLADPVTIN